MHIHVHAASTWSYLLMSLSPSADCKLANGKEIKNGTEEFFFSNGSCSTWYVSHPVILLKLLLWSFTIIVACLIVHQECNLPPPPLPPHSACIEGRSLCMSERCNPLTCPEQDWIFLPGLCCPVCPIIEEEPTDQVELHCQMDTEDGTVQLLNGASYTQPCASWWVCAECLYACIHLQQ